jgi:hypothetical protein
MMGWDEWRGSVDGRPSMYIKRLISFRGYRLDLHKMVRADDEGCFHTHPALAIRFVLWGGYVEQFPNMDTISWGVGAFGLVRPQLNHRIHRIKNNVSSFSLWLRWPKSDSIKITGC